MKRPFCLLWPSSVRFAEKIFFYDFFPYKMKNFLKILNFEARAWKMFKNYSKLETLPPHTCNIFKYIIYILRQQPHICHQAEVLWRWQKVGPKLRSNILSASQNWRLMTSAWILSSCNIQYYYISQAELSLLKNIKLIQIKLAHIVIYKDGVKSYKVLATVWA